MLSEVWDYFDRRKKVAFFAAIYEKFIYIHLQRMSPYGIFVVSLTIGYILYFAYNIIKDVHGKKSADRDDEVFEIDEPIVVAVPVKETSDGFSLGDKHYEMSDTTDAADVSSRLTMTQAAMDSMDAIEPESTGGIDNTELTEILQGDMTRYKPTIKVYRDRF